jgi:hypothetical protein
MLLGMDHLVIGVGDLGAAMREFAVLGFSVAPGATLDQRLSHGARLSFG